MKHFIFLFAMFIGSCSTPNQTTDQTSEPTKHFVLVTLKEDVTGKHLQKTYQQDDIESIRANNRTKNIYACQFVKNQKALDKIMEKMKKDANIIHVELANTKLDPPTNSTSTKSTKAKPGKN